MNNNTIIDTTGLATAVAEAVNTIDTILRNAGNDSVAYAARSTLGELVGSLQRLPNAQAAN